MEPRSGRGKARVGWSTLIRRWYVHYADHTYFFAKWENAIYFATSAVTTDRRTREGMQDHDAD